MVIQEYGNPQGKVFLLLHPMLADGKTMTTAKVLLAFGSKDADYKQRKKIEKNYPKIRFWVHEGYGHCEYLARFPKKYFAGLGL